MLSRRIKKGLVLLLAVWILAPVTVPNAVATEYPPKTSPELKEAMTLFDGPYPVYIVGTVPSREELAEGQEVFDEYVDEFMEEVGLEKSALILNNIYTYYMAKGNRPSMDSASPLVAAWLTREEIERVAHHETVTYLMYIANNYGPYFRPVLSESMSAREALLILQMSVGLTSGTPYMIGHDVNMDGHITALDALIALQESVGLIAIGYPQYLGTSVPEKWDREGAYDWELERIPANLFMYAGDVNGDGVADDIDLLLKYNYLWV